MDPLKILFLAADPSDRATRKFDREFHLIGQKIRASEYRDAIKMVKVGAVRPEDLLQQLLQHDPDIVHFTGHGETGGIVFEDEHGNSRLVKAEALAAVFEALAGKVRLVFLNAGYSAKQAEAISAHVDFVVGMGYRIILEAASSLASSFYQAVGFGRSVQNAFDVGKAAVMLQGIPDESIPRLLVREDADAWLPLCGPGAESGSVSGSASGSVSGSGPASASAQLAGPSVELPAKLLHLLEPLREKMHRSENIVVPLVGSGLCKPELPTWSEFITSLIDLAPAHLVGEVRELLDDKRYLDIAELLEAEPTVGASVIAEKIRQTYQRPEAAASEVYDLIAALPCAHFATTHYDPWLKEAVSRRYPAPRIYSPRDPGAFTDLGPESSPLVLMLHGDADRPEQCVLSQRSYAALEHGFPAYREALGGLAGQRSFLFIGHSMSDPDILAVLEEWPEVFKARGGAPRHYLLGVGLKAHDQLKLTRLGVTPIEYGRESNASLLAAVLHYLARPPGSELEPEPPEITSRPAARSQPGERDNARFKAALPQYAAWAREIFSHLNMAGLGGGQLRLSLDDVFVPLRYATHGQYRRGIGGFHGELSDGAHRGPERDITLARAFPHAAPAKHLFILGDPGSGKTTALKKLLWSALGRAGNAVSGAAFDGTSIGLASATVPVFLPLRDLDASSLHRPLADFLDHQLAKKGGAAMASGFGQWLWQRGDVLLLFDGLDEVADPDLRVEVCKYLERELRGESAASIRAVVSCRFAGEVGQVGFDDSFAALEIRPLRDDQITALTSRWFQAAGRVIAQSTGGDVERAAQEGFAAGQELARTLGAETSRRIKTLVANPLLLTLLCVVVRAGNKIPRQRVAFFADCLRTLIERWRADQWLQLPDALSLLQPLAAYLHRAQRKDLFQEELRTVWQPALNKLEMKLGQRVSFGQAVDCLCRESGVLTEFARGEYGFMHLSLQEYLTAQHLAANGDVETLASSSGDPWWRESTLLFVALNGYRLFTPLLCRLVAGDALVDREDWLRELLAEAHTPETEALIEVLQAEDESGSRVMAALRLAKPWADDAVRDAARELAKRWPRESAVHELAARVGELGEPVAGVAEPGQRFEEERTGIRFLWIAPGRFRMGDDRSEYDEEKPAHQVEISGFWLAETPVTNREYGVFLEATGHEEPENWRDRRYNDPEQPVVGVTWFDARAFCDWSSEVAGQRITLPSEAQWEYAARGPDNRMYPWGDEQPDEKRASFGNNHGRPSPVRSLPDGRGPFGTYDQAGNVWEWVQDEWDENAYKDRTGAIVDPLADHHREQISPEDPRASARGARGGSWFDHAQYLRAAFRDGSVAVGAYVSLGFRVACLPAVEGRDT